MESKIKALQGELDAEKERNKSLQSMQEKSDKVKNKINSPFSVSLKI
jgi:hypothetical protein